eukprot:COSAG02_NODE_673_length_18630_cov_7.960768_9_plen_108_part_00
MLYLGSYYSHNVKLHGRFPPPSLRAFGSPRTAGGASPRAPPKLVLKSGAGTGILYGSGRARQGWVGAVEFLWGLVLKSRGVFARSHGGDRTRTYRSQFCNIDYIIIQ